MTGFVASSEAPLSLAIFSFSRQHACLDLPAFSGCLGLQPPRFPEDLLLLVGGLSPPAPSLPLGLLLNPRQSKPLLGDGLAPTRRWCPWSTPWIQWTMVCPGPNLAAPVSQHSPRMSGVSWSSPTFQPSLCHRLNRSAPNTSGTGWPFSRSSCSMLPKLPGLRCLTLDMQSWRPSKNLSMLENSQVLGDLYRDTIRPPGECRPEPCGSCSFFDRTVSKLRNLCRAHSCWPALSCAMLLAVHLWVLQTPLALLPSHWCKHGSTGSALPRPVVTTPSHHIGQWLLTSWGPTPLNLKCLEDF